ncbi:MAG: hypothetical protein JWM27_3554 [Gemmatimonadetes bacterium]|nr:hypothetical protein [Gemmatimonadota bacterium]
MLCMISDVMTVHMRYMTPCHVTLHLVSAERASSPSDGARGRLRSPVCRVVRFDREGIKRADWRSVCADVAKQGMLRAGRPSLRPAPAGCGQAERPPLPASPAAMIFPTGPRGSAQTSRLPPAHAGPSEPQMRTARPRTLAVPALLALLAACGGGDGRQVLTVYSPHGRDMLKAFEAAYERANPGVDLQFVDMGSQEILDRLRSEKANPQADVWFGAPAYTFAQGAADSLLERFVPTWATAVPAEARDPAGYWHGTYLTPEVIAYNSKRVTGAQVPADWDDVLDPRWKGKVLIRDPMASGTMRTIFGMAVLRSLRQTGDTAQGWRWLRRLDGQTKEYVLNPTLLYQKLAREEGLVTLWDLPDLEELRSHTDLPIAYVLPRSGTPVLVDAIGVVKGAQHPELARAFVEWAGSAPQVTAAARTSFRLPARTDVPDSALPEPLRRAKQALKAEPMDWRRFEKESPGWMRYWDTNVRGRR